MATLGWKTRLHDQKNANLTISQAVVVPIESMTSY